MRPVIASLTKQSFESMIRRAEIAASLHYSQSRVTRSVPIMSCPCKLQHSWSVLRYQTKGSRCTTAANGCGSGSGSDYCFLPISSIG
jgi:hypothetical protein